MTVELKHPAKNTIILATIQPLVFHVTDRKPMGSLLWTQGIRKDGESCDTSDHSRRSVTELQNEDRIVWTALLKSSKRTWTRSVDEVSQTTNNN